MCAWLDVREEGQFGDGHPFLAVNCPYSHFEQLVSRLVPSTWVPTILVDEGDGVSIQAAELMALMGYTHVFCVEGGIPAWRAQGLNLYKGVNLPSKTLGEWVEHQENIHRITPTQLADWQSTRKPFHFFDCRPPNEYAKMTVPGAQSVPNGELAHRWAAVVKDDITPIVLTCAGRTRGCVAAKLYNRPRTSRVGQCELRRGQAPSLNGRGRSTPRDHRPRPLSAYGRCSCRATARTARRA
jgi:rhodanese-related sulfurtransferase